MTTVYCPFVDVVRRVIQLSGGRSWLPVITIPRHCVPRRRSAYERGG